MSIKDKLRRIKKQHEKAKRKAAKMGLCNTCEEQLEECWCDSMADFAACG